MKKNRSAELYAKLMYLVVHRNETTNHHFFLDYSGHCKCFEITIYRDGWKEGKDRTFHQSWYLVKLRNIKEAINIVRNFK